MFATLMLSTALAAEPAAPAPANWEATLDAAVPAVVTLRVSATRPFDTEGAADVQGTGFVVDAARGLILTNRHMVFPGPVRAEAVFLDHEEVELRPVYRDPVHDFGIFRFDPADVHYMDIVELPLAPEEARVGTEIRVVGNDAGERISILQGTLARLDRAAPGYGTNTYNDFNTFYYQAASGTSGGSSGSPVLDIHGHVVALNAGGRRSAATSFYLPLDRVVRALDLVRAGRPVPRGTIQAVLSYTHFDELRRLGLRPETEAAMRSAFPGGTGMLVVAETVRGGPAEGKLQPGDVLVELDGSYVASFLPVDAALDDNIGREIALEVERGGKPLTVELRVQDLQRITPAEYVELGGAVIHPLSYQQARNHGEPAGTLYVANPGYTLASAGIPDGALIRAVDGKEVTSLDAFVAALAPRADGQRIPVRYSPLDDPRQDRVGVITMDRLWFPFQRCRMDPASGLWPCEAAGTPGPAPPLQPASTTMPSAGPRPARALSASMVMVDFDIPYRTEGVWGTHFRGTGLVVDTERGLVVVDRDTVPIALGDVSITFGGSLRVPGRVRFIHPTHDIAVVSYDPALIGDTPVRAAVLDDRPLATGDRAWMVGLDHDSKLVWRETQVASVQPLSLPYPSPPRFRDHDIEVVDLQAAAPSVGGVVADRRGRVRDTWASFPTQDGGEARSMFYGLPVEMVRMVVDPLREGHELRWHDLGVELRPVTLADARELGLSAAWARVLEQHDPQRRQVLAVARTTSGFPAASDLRGGDLLLALDGEPATRFIEVERAAQSPQVRLTVLRDGQELRVEVPTVALDGRGIDRAVAWSGVLLHDPHLAVASQRGIAPRGVYVAWYWYGSPAARYGLRPTRRILEVDGVPTPDLDTFLRVISGRTGRVPVRLTTADLDDQVKVITLKTDPDYWPTWVFRQDEDGWHREPLE